MPLRDGKKINCCTNRSRLELILMGVIFIVTLIAVILLIFILLKPSQAKPVELSPNTCHTPTCIQEATKIIERIDPNINPCEDFYGFACGNFIKSSHGDDKFNVFYQMSYKRKRELIEMYSEGIQDHDHKIVKSVKNLFRQCSNENGIEMDNLNSIKVALEEIGGWPALFKGSNWNESNFDWLKATYKLRELGYPYSVFLNLDIVEDRQNKGRYIFKVEAPEFYNSMLNKYSKEHAVEIMTEIAVSFGAEDKPFAGKQMDGIYRFWKFLQTFGLYRATSRITINDFQEQYGNTFNWLEAINNITGPTVQVSKSDYVLFQDHQGLRSWLDLITTTPKRTLANYMIWKVIEEQLPYLTKSIRNLDTKIEDQQQRMDESLFWTLDETRAEFCLKEIQKRFIPSPIEILCDRKYLPSEQRKHVEEILLNIKSELVSELKNANWMAASDKKIAIAKAESVTIIVGQPGDYFDDKILDDLNIDMVEVETDTFLNLMAQADRNRQTILYNRINQTTFADFMNRPFIKDTLDFSVYDEEDNVIFMPVIATQGFAFQDDRPNYLNYAAIGYGFSSLSNILSRWFYFDNTAKWSKETMLPIKNMRKCLTDNLKTCGLGVRRMSPESFSVSLNFGEQITYAAYKKWAKLNGEEKKLIGVEYTPQQLFWISGTYCYTTNMYSTTSDFFVNDPMFFQRVTCAARSINHDFAKDFNCPTGSRMNPDVKCKLV